VVLLLVVPVAALALVALVEVVRLRRELRRVEGARDAAVEDADAGVERARTESAVRQRLGLALDAVTEGVVVTDEAGRVVLRNVTAEAYRDPRHGDALVAAAVDELLERALVGEPGTRSVELFGPPRRVLVVRAEPLVGSGGPAGALATIEDVTERRRLEEVRRDFVANISHELRTPVGAISLLAETLAGEDDPATASRLAGRVVDEAARVTATIEDLLALTRIEHEDDPVRQAVPLRVVVADAVSRIEPAATQRGIAIRVEGPEPDVVVPGDRRQLASALYNLLDNAVKYSDPGAVVAVEVGLDDGTASLQVTDQGIGIPASDLDRVFERFYRVDAGRSRQTGGTGLGLAIVRHVAANHRGEVDVRSRQGEGSTFTLRLPASETFDHAPVRTS
jgi:two-component system sensor histidine kinase SenX3